MSDYQGRPYSSGPYTPGDEPPLAFERRRPPGREKPRRSGPPPVTLILSAVLLLGVGGAVAFMYRAGLRAPSGPPRPVGTPIGEVRLAAPPEAQPADPAAGLTIYRETPPPAAPAFTPPPEQPQPRGAPLAPPAPAASAAPVTASSAAEITGAAAVVAKPTASPKPNPPVKPRTRTIDTLLAESSAPPNRTAADRRARSSADAPGHAAEKPATKTSARAAAKHDKDADQAASAKAPAKSPSHDKTSGKAGADEAAAAKSSHAAVVQIGAFSSRDLAAAAAGRGAGAGHARRIVPVTRADGSVLYRASLTGFASRDDAAAFCAKLKAAGSSCFVPR